MDLAAAGDRYVRHHVRVHDTQMAYVDTGRGQDLGLTAARSNVVVFLHGNPTSSFLWRNVIPRVESVARCLAPDLVGMGESGKAPSGGYRFVDHARYLDAWFDAVGLERDVTLVVHDWGGALGFDWARRHPERVSGVVYMETIVRPLTWAEWPENARKVFQGMRSPAGEDLVLQKNVFVERILPASIMRKLSEDEMDVYRAPFREPGESRRPTLTWPREIPVDGEPSDVVTIVSDSASWLARSSTPKLFINAEPGSILVGTQREVCRAWPNQREVTVRGLHFVQEDSPGDIGRAVAAFVEKQ